MNGAPDFVSLSPIYIPKKSQGLSRLFQNGFRAIVGIAYFSNNVTQRLLGV